MNKKLKSFLVMMAALSSAFCVASWLISSLPDDFFPNLLDWPAFIVGVACFTGPLLYIEIRTS